MLAAYTKTNRFAKVLADKAPSFTWLYNYFGMKRKRRERGEEKEGETEYSEWGRGGREMQNKALMEIIRREGV